MPILSCPPRDLGGSAPPGPRGLGVKAYAPPREAGSQLPAPSGRPEALGLHSSPLRPLSLLPSLRPEVPAPEPPGGALHTHSVRLHPGPGGL